VSSAQNSGSNRCIGIRKWALESPPRIEPSAVPLTMAAVFFAGKEIDFAQRLQILFHPTASRRRPVKATVRRFQSNR
jgi:hypothetical protein